MASSRPGAVCGSFASSSRPLVVARHLFEALLLGPMLNRAAQPLRHRQPLSERVLPLVANRLTRPGSEHALAESLEDFYVVTAQGSLWMPQWNLGLRELSIERVHKELESLRLRVDEG